MFRIGKTRRLALLAGVALPMAVATGAAVAEEKPESHGDTPAAQYEPSLSTLDELKVEIPGRKPGDPVITPSEFQTGSKILFGSCLAE